MFLKSTPGYTGHKINSLVRGSHKRDMMGMLSNQTVNDPQVEDILYWRVIGQDFSMSGKIYPDQSVRTLHLIKHMKHAMTLKVRFMVLKFILPNLIFQPVKRPDPRSNQMRTNYSTQRVSIQIQIKKLRLLVVESDAKQLDCF